MEGISEQRGWRGWGVKAALAVGGMLAGGVLAATLTANAASTANQAVSNGYGAYGAAAGSSQRGQRPNEQPLTGDTAAKVKAAALAKYPGATIVRVETDADGVYEAHLTTKDGRQVTVEVDTAFKVTGEESHPGRP